MTCVVCDERFNTDEITLCLTPDGWAMAHDWCAPDPYDED